MHTMLTNITVALDRRLASVSKFLPRALPRSRKKLPRVHHCRS